MPDNPVWSILAKDLPLHPQFVVAAIDRLAAADAVFTADVSTP